jgi:hypothetical protein
VEATLAIKTSPRPVPDASLTRDVGAASGPASAGAAASPPLARQTNRSRQSTFRLPVVVLDRGWQPFSWVVCGLVQKGKVEDRRGRIRVQRREWEAARTQLLNAIGEGKITLTGDPPDNLHAGAPEMISGVKLAPDQLTGIEVVDDIFDLRDEPAYETPYIRCMYCPDHRHWRDEFHDRFYSGRGRLSLVRLQVNMTEVLAVFPLLNGSVMPAASPSVTESVASSPPIDLPILPSPVAPKPVVSADLDNHWPLPDKSPRGRSSGAAWRAMTALYPNGPPRARSFEEIARSVNSWLKVGSVSARTVSRVLNPPARFDKRDKRDKRDKLDR